MGISAFDDFVQREQASVIGYTEESVDWRGEKELWLKHVDELFAQVSGYLKPYVDAGQITIEFEKVELNEEHIGPYSALSMLIRIGSKTISLTPIGTLLIGSKGRVDVIGPAARAQLMLLDSTVTRLSQAIRFSVGVGGELPVHPPPNCSSEIDWAWRIVTRPPQREIVEVNKDTFLNLLLEIANG